MSDHMFNQYDEMEEHAPTGYFDCPFCGSWVDDDLRYCKHCGEFVEPEDDQ